MDKRPFYTIGHSSRPVEAFVGLLNGAAIEVVADIRRVPRSRAQPQFNAESLARSLAGAGVHYEHFPALGGLRKRSRGTPRDLNGFWQQQSFHNYADYALSNDFRCGLASLRERGHESTCAVMCAEAVWWRCHRRIISDYLIAAGEIVFHILGPNQVERAALTRAAKVLSPGTITYPS